MMRIMLALMFSLMAATAWAGPLAPSKASQVVTLESNSACDVAGQKMDTRILPDSAVEPFAIPEGQVLVLTGIEWSFAVAAGQAGLVDLVLDQPGPGGFNTVFHAGAPAPGNGIGRGSAAIPNVVVRPGVQICAVFPFGGQAKLHGFLAKDK